MGIGQELLDIDPAYREKTFTAIKIIDTRAHPCDNLFDEDLEEVLH